MNPDELLEEMRIEFRAGRGARPKPRRYVAGLLISFCDLLTELQVPSHSFHSLADLFEVFPRITEGVSTLTVRMPEGGQKTIRLAYERAQAYFIYGNKRLDYPRSQRYATGKWEDYRGWLDALVGFAGEDLAYVANQTRAFVLDELAPHVFDPTTVLSEPPIFRMLLSDFTWEEMAKGETRGAAYQAAVFGFIRAAAPHLQVQAHKVRTGSLMQVTTGDIDAWEGDRLAISSMVEAFVVDEALAEQLEFFSSEVRQLGALGTVVVMDFKDQTARDAIESLGLVPLSRSDLVRIVSLWDPLKQRAALNAFEWAVHREQNGPLMGRVAEFLANVGYRQPVPAVAPPLSKPHAC